ncbi:MAG: metal-dependent hydrolase [Burkholderiales bacterium]
MDSVTQAVLGAGVAGICAPPRQRRKALLIGAALGTLPDLDVLIDYGDPVSNFTYHRGFSHSLLVLFPFSVILWLLLRRSWSPVRDAPMRWLAAIMLTLVTHPLLDAHTVYGTQLFWPVPTPPVMWSTLFIIDPAYTLPLLIGVLVAAIFPRRKAAPIALAAGIMISTSYIGWSWIAKSIIEHHAIAALKTMGLQGAPRFSIPTPFNTLLWRVVVMTDSGYMEGYRSLVADGGPMTFTAYGSDKASLESASDLPAVARLRWFTHDFMRTQVRQDKLILSDLRMGVEPTYIFSFAVATRGNPHWHAIKPERYRISIQSRNLMQFWDRIWHQPR